MHWIDPDSLVPVKSQVASFLFNPKGDADGMLLANGMEAHFPPHLSRKVLKLLQPGDTVTLYGVKPRGVEMIACIAIEDKHGERIDDHRPPAKKKHSKKHHEDDDRERATVELEDSIERKLHGPKGEVRGVLLTDGSIVRFPPHVADGAARKLLRPAAKLAVRGEAITASGTRIIEAKGLGTTKKTIKRFEPKPHH
jgi:hypothetical protein